MSVNPIHPVPSLYSDNILAGGADLPYPHIYVLLLIIQMSYVLFILLFIKIYCTENICKGL